MSSDEDAPSGTLSPDDAFAVLGNPTRMSIIQALASADGPLAFSDLRDRVGVADSGQFNYHLDKLDGHFISKGEGGYQLRQSAARVIEAVLSGTVIGSASLDTARIDAPCPYCGADIELTYREERMLLRCPECPGSYADIPSTSPAYPVLPEGSIALYYLPPAGVEGRSRREMLDAVLDWTYSEHLAIDRGVCPRCSGRFEFSIEACSDHTYPPPMCQTCGRRSGVTVRSACVNCNHYRGHMLTDYVFYRPPVRPFFEARGIDPVLPAWEDMGAFYDVEEAVDSTDPFEARLTYTVDGDSVTVRVDGELDVAVVDPA